MQERVEKMKECEREQDDQKFSRGTDLLTEERARSVVVNVFIVFSL